MTRKGIEIKLHSKESQTPLFDVFNRGERIAQMEVLEVNHQPAGQDNLKEAEGLAYSVAYQMKLNR